MTKESKDKKSVPAVLNKPKGTGKSPKEIRQDIRKLLHEKFSIKSK
jgi:hypothetical protein